MGETIGKGTYGVVTKAKDRITGADVAIKKMKMDSNEGISPVILRETAILRDLNHAHIVNLLSVIIEKDSVSLVFEYMPMDLKRFQDENKKGLTGAQIKSFMYQLLLGLRYLHSKQVFHRDIKPQNILLKDNVLKIADFGLSRSFSVPLQSYTKEVITQWYRPPELFLGEDHYSAAIDIWSAGCIFGELSNGMPLFRGDFEIQVLFSIFKHLGTPTDETWPGVMSLPYMNKDFPHWPKSPISKLVPTLEPEGQKLLEQMLELDPSKRISAYDALQSDYFKDIGLYYSDASTDLQES